jgi:hypothetical protein
MYNARKEKGVIEITGIREKSTYLIIIVCQVPPFQHKPSLGPSLEAKRAFVQASKFETNMLFNHK